MFYPVFLTWTISNMYLSCEMLASQLLSIQQLYMSTGEYGKVQKTMITLYLIHKQEHFLSCFPDPPCTFYLSQSYNTVLYFQYKI